MARRKRKFKLHDWENKTMEGDLASLHLTEECESDPKFPDLQLRKKKQQLRTNRYLDRYCEKKVSGGK